MDSLARQGRPAGHIVEIFSGIQGEGIYVGRRQIFLRMSGCNFHCRYCDQPEALGVCASALVEQTPGVRDFICVPNPLSPADVARAVKQLAHPAGLHHVLAITGGEPLLQEDFLAGLLPKVRSRQLKILLETNGTRPEALQFLLPHVDIVSMDIKLKSATGRPMPLSAHEKFLRASVRRGVEVYVKVVVAAETRCSEICRAARLVAAVAKATPFILQPLTPAAGSKEAPPRPDLLLALQESALRYLRDVRVIPQTHKTMGQR